MFDRFDRLGLPAAAAAMLLASMPAAAQPDWQFSDVERVVAVADIHGAYPAFERILRRAEVIDADGAWSGGDTHLVIVGDVLDRGPDSRRALDLIIALEPEARAAGGRVHLVLGNHEVMNLTGDLRYVAPGEYAAFAADERPEEREAGFALFSETLDEEGDADAARRRFDQMYPPGFFAHRAAFAREGRYGAWLVQQPFLIVIDGVAFVHAGLATAVVESGSELNAVLHADLGDYLDTIESLQASGAMSRMDDLNDWIERTAASADSAGADRVIDLQSRLLMSPDGPIWYRGNASCNRLTELGRLREALAGIGAERVVIGHTPTRDALVLSRLDATILRIDTGMLAEYYGGRASALVIEDGRLSALYEDEDTPSSPVEQPRHVGLRPAGLDTGAIETLLGTGRIVRRQAFEGREHLLTLTDGTAEIDAVFLPSTRGAALSPVAAYRLDRLLGLDMVPVTVAREIDGNEGSLQFWPPRTIGESERSEQGLGGSAWCPLGDQLADMYRFDALIFNEARTIDRIRYSTEDLQLLLIGHEQTFTTDRGRPAYLERIPVELTPQWRAALAGLDEERLTDALGDVLDRRRIRALLERRDFLLDADAR